jgi:uncharacterized protein YjaZ
MKASMISRAALIGLTMPLVLAAMAGPALGREKMLHFRQMGVQARFESAAHHSFSAAERTRIQSVLDATHAAVRADFPQLADSLSVTVVPVDRDLSSVGGVAGRADAPGQILIEISTTGEGGTVAAISQGLAAAFAHELHHLVRGWTIMGNHYGPGIAIAAANEGLAVAYSEHLTGQVFAGNRPPEDAVARAWAAEIRALPVDAHYGEWMFAHPDGREGIGYRTGRFIVQRAMENSGRDVISLTSATPEEVWALAGLD